MAELTKKQIFNAKSNSVSLKDMVGKRVKITGVTISYADDEKMIMLMMGECEGVVSYFCTTSDNIIKMSDDICDVIEDDGFAECIVRQRKSRNNRDFLSLEIC